MDNSSNAPRLIAFAAIGLAVVGSIIFTVVGLKPVQTTNAIVARKPIKKGSGISWQDVGILPVDSVVKGYPDYAKEADKLSFNTTTKRVGTAKRNLKIGEPIYSKSVTFDKGVLVSK